MGNRSSCVIMSFPLVALFVTLMLSVTSSRARPEVQLHLTTASDDFSTRGYWVFRDEIFSLKVTLSNPEPLRRPKVTLTLPVTSQWKLEPLLRSYGISNGNGTLQNVNVTSQEQVGEVAFQLSYGGDSSTRSDMLTLDVKASDVKVGDILPIEVMARIEDSGPNVITHDQVTVECVGPCLRLSTTTLRPDGDVQGGDVIKSLEVKVESCPEATEAAEEVKFQLTSSDPGITFENISLSGKNHEITTVSDKVHLIATEWFMFGILDIGDHFVIEFDCRITNDVLLNSNISISTTVQYKSSQGQSYSEAITSTWPTNRIELQRCEADVDWLIPTGRSFQILTCIRMPPGSIHLDINARLLSRDRTGDVSIEITEGKVTSQRDLLFADESGRQFSRQALKRRRRDDTNPNDESSWSIGLVTNPDPESSDVIIATRMSPSSDKNAKARLVVGMTSLGEILERDVVVTSSDLNVTKTLTISQNKTTAVGSSDEFRIAVSGFLLANLTASNVTVTESTTGIDVIGYVRPPTNDWTIEENSAFFSVPVLSGTDEISVQYDAKLNADVVTSSTFDVITTVQYFVGNNTRKSLSVPMCIEPVKEETSQTSVGLAVLIIIICFIAGALLAFLIIILILCIPKASPLIEPTGQQNSFSTRRKPRKLDNFSHPSDMSDVFVEDNRTKMIYYVEILELEELIELRRAILKERSLVMKEVVSLILAQSKRIEKEKFHHDKRRRQITSQPTGPLISDPEELENLEKKHQIELEELNDRIRDFHEKFQEEMTSLATKRHANDVIDRSYLLTLLEQRDASRQATTIDGKDDFGLQQPNDVTIKITSFDNRVTRELMRIFARGIRAVERKRASRDEVVSSWLGARGREKNLWNEMLKRQVELLKMALRERRITEENHSEFLARTIQCVRDVQAKFESDLQDVRPAKKENDLARQIDDVLRDVNDADDVEEWLNRRMEIFKKHMDAENEGDMHDNVFAEEQSKILHTCTTHLRQSLDDVRQRLRKSLHNADDVARIDVVIAKQDEALDDLQFKNSRIAPSVPNQALRLSCVTNDVMLDLLKKIYAAQPFVAKQEHVERLEAENELLRDQIDRIVYKRIDARLNALRRFVDGKQSAIDDVTREYDSEQGIRSEMHRKLVISSSLEENSNSAWVKGQRDVTKICDIVSTALSGQAARISENFYLGRDLSAVEDIKMTLLKCLTSSKVISSDECKRLIENNKAKVDEIKERFALERKRKEENLKRKTERTLLLRKNEIAAATTKTSRSTSDPLYASDDVIKKSRSRLEEERGTLQELFAARHKVHLAQEEALLEQEMVLVKGLSQAAKIPKMDMVEALELLIPNKSSRDISILCNVIAPHEKNEPSKMSEHFLPLIREIAFSSPGNSHGSSPDKGSVEFSETRQSKKLSPLAGVSGYPGIRPEPLGRIASPNTEENGYQFTQPSSLPSGTRRKGKRKGTLKALKKKPAQTRADDLSYNY